MLHVFFYKSSQTYDTKKSSRPFNEIFYNIFSFLKKWERKVTPDILTTRWLQIFFWKWIKNSVAALFSGTVRTRTLSYLYVGVPSGVGVRLSLFIHFVF
jgi:hypothetical protein